MATPATAKASTPHPAESSHGKPVHLLAGVTAQVRYFIAFRNSAAVSGKRKIVGIPDSRTDPSIIKTLTGDEQSLQKRKTWCGTSSFSLDIATTLQVFPALRAHRPLRPISAIGFLRTGFSDLPFLQPHDYSITSTLVQRPHPLSSDSSFAASSSADDITVPTVMTPTKEKQPLPSSKVVNVQYDHITSFAEWRAALEEVRVLCLRREWKPCINRCETLLEDSHNNPHPMHECYLQFFHALAHELLARSMHDLSVAKLPHFESSKKSYTAASSSLLLSSKILRDEEFEEQHLGESFFMSGNTSPMSTPTPTPRKLQLVPSPRSSMFSPSPSWISSPLNWVSPSQAFLANDPTFGSPLRKPSPLRIAPIWLSSSQASLANDPEFGSPITKPTPLRVTKKVSTLGTPLVKSDVVRSPPMTPLPTTSYQVRTPATVTFSESTTTWLHDRAMQRFNTHVVDFEQMLQRHVEVVDMLIKSTMEVQADSHTVKRSDSQVNDEETRTADRRAKIEKLKANNWKRERFRPERYQDLCARALAEL